jgi:hypothetical protein
VGTTLSAVEEYDPVTDTWTKKSDLPIKANISLSLMLVSILLSHPGFPMLPPTQELFSVSFWYLLMNVIISQGAREKRIDE